MPVLLLVIWGGQDGKVPGFVPVYTGSFGWILCPCSFDCGDHTMSMLDFSTRAFAHHHVFNFCEHPVDTGFAAMTLATAKPRAHIQQ